MAQKLAETTDNILIQNLQQLVKNSRMRFQMCKFRLEYCVHDDQKDRLLLSKQCASTDKEITKIYSSRIMQERKKQKQQQKLGESNNECIFVAKRFSAITYKREQGLTDLECDGTELFGRPYFYQRRKTISALHSVFDEAQQNKEKLIQESVQARK